MLPNAGRHFDAINACLPFAGSQAQSRPQALRQRGTATRAEKAGCRSRKPRPLGRREGRRPGRAGVQSLLREFNREG